MKREDAIASVLRTIDDETVVIACNGHISRTVYSTVDRPTFFYMIGSMGLAPSIALGLALARPERNVVVLDGDANVLMNLGSLASVGAASPARFVHFCFDNGRHASTGGQRTIAERVNLAAIARAAGYLWVESAERADDLARLAAAALDARGPAFLHVRVEPGGLAPGTARVEISPPVLAQRLRQVLA